MFSTDRKRSAVAVGTAASLVLSLIGGATVLLFSGHDVPSTPAALKPVEPPAASVPPPPAEPEPSLGEADLSMFGLGGGDDASALLSGGDSSMPSGSAADMFSTSAAFTPSSGTVPALPAFQLPSASDLPPGAVVDWPALVAPLVAAQNTAQAVNITNSVLGTSVGATVAVLNTGAVLLGDLILYAALTNNGQGVLNELQAVLPALVAAPTAAAAVETLTAAAAAAQLPPVPDLTGLTAAFAAMAATPSGIGVAALPPLPAPPLLPTPEQVVGGMALGAAALPALPGLPSLPMPGLPPPPQLPRPEEVVGGIAGGIVGLAIAGAVLGGIGAIFQPPSLTRMMGLPF
ncbi:MAG: hypothetical protein QG655_3753 [Actinomycetota bacterium]|jgi:hypothetical protein|nr:hypothetical protein [Actinomycetota bacterium]